LKLNAAAYVIGCVLAYAHVFMLIIISNGLAVWLGIAKPKKFFRLYDNLLFTIITQHKSGIIKFIKLQWTG